MFQIKAAGRKNDGSLHPSAIYSIQNNSGVPLSFFFEDFIYTQEIERQSQRQEWSEI